MEGFFLNFAYGSNMGHRRLQARTPSAEFVGIAKLSGYRLAFHMPGWDGSAKADCFKTNDPADHVYGALYRIQNSERAALDAVEGAGVAYDPVLIMVLALPEGKPVQALAYLALKRKPGLVAHDWYMQHVLIGADEIGLPPKYIEMIKSFPVQKDPDNSQRARELSIYS